ASTRYHDCHLPYCVLLFFDHPSSAEIYTLSLHDALPISSRPRARSVARPSPASRSLTTSRAWATCSTNSAPSWASRPMVARTTRSEEHTSELQSRFDLVCRLLLEKKKASVHCMWMKNTMI